jgi:hypothetical protein
MGLIKNGRTVGEKYQDDGNLFTSVSTRGATQNTNRNAQLQECKKVKNKTRSK